jgi:hypothetical protein
MVEALGGNYQCSWRFNDGSVDCTVVCAIRSVMMVALTGFGYLSWNSSTAETKQAPIKRLAL